MLHPLVSVVMPVFNAEKYLRESIESILSQTFETFEFIIINDGSNDDSVEIINSYNDKRIVLIDQENTGLPTALNNGIKIAKSKYIARMDADDISLPIRLKEQYDYLEKNNNVIAVGTHANIIDMDGNYVCNSRKSLSNEEICKNFPETPFIHPSVMFRKEMYLKAGGYLNVPIVEDVLFFISMSKLGNLENLDLTLINYRLSPQAISRKSKRTVKISNEIVSCFYKTGSLFDKDLTRIRKSLKKSTFKEKVFQYYILLAKKYLWTNNQPKLARKNIRNGLKYCKSNPIPYSLYLISYLPSKLVIKIYKKIKFR